MTTEPKAVYKHCMRCGSTVVYEPDNSVWCNSCGFCYYINAASAVALLILNERGELLLTKRAYEPEKGKLDLPGGFVDIGESAEDAAKRELKEELNLEIDGITYIGSYPNEYVYSGVTIYTLDMAFVGKVADFQHMKADDDVTAFEFYAVKDIDLNEIAFTSIRQIISDFIDNLI